MSEPIQPPPSVGDGIIDTVRPELTTTEKPGASQNTGSTSSAPAIDVRAFADGALHFLATASNETLGACLVGLGAGTYLVLGRVGLLLIGVVGGVVLHATWERHAHGDAVDIGAQQETRRREVGVHVARRVLDWRDEKAQKQKDEDGEGDMDVLLYSGKQLDYSEFRPETAAALTELTDAVVRDYVKWWYSPILPQDDSFPAECRRILTAFILSLSSHLTRKRPADSFVDFVTRSSSFMLVFFQELSGALGASPNATVPDAVDTYLQLKPNTPLAEILDTKRQAKQFDDAAVDILQSYLDAKTYNCRPASVFLRQMLSGVVLEMIVLSCSKPEFINGWIVYLLEDGEPELLNAIDASVEGSSGQLENAKLAIQKGEAIADPATSAKVQQHKRVVSDAQEAMDDAMHEAQRLSQLIAEEDARRLKEKKQQNASTSTLNDDQSENTTQGIVTPTSSQSETLTENDVGDLGISALPSQSPSYVSSPSPTNQSEEAPKEESKAAFTSFDQLIQKQPPTALMATPPPPLTLHNSNIAIFDDAMPGEKTVIKSKPAAEYLIQIEPASQYHSGWMTARKYTDLETLHEVLRRIAAVAGATGFVEAHAALPSWKGHTKASLRGELERYLNDALQYKPLAESEGMKRFLEKDSQMGKSPGGSKGFPGIGWPGQTFENMGKGMIDVLTKAPQEVAGGGKKLFGGVTGVLGSVTTPLGGARKKADSVSNSPGPLSRSGTVSTPPVANRHGRAESIIADLPTHIRTESTMSSFSRRTSTDSLRNPVSPIIDQQPGREAPMERRPSYNPDGDGKRSKPSSVFSGSRSNSRAPSIRESMDLSPVMGGDQILNLPPMPSDIADDYNIPPTRTSIDPYHSSHASRQSTTSLPLPNEPVPPLPRRPSATSLASSIIPPKQPTTQASKPSISHAPLSEQETTVLIELFFATINELYTLSSAWQIRLTLLNAAKTFLLRPGNPQLTSIQTLIQSTVLEANTSDAGIALHLRKMRQNSMPTEDELKLWPAEPSADEKETLRKKARKLLVERGMPQALTSVMGQVASGEALGRVFDALQDARMARGVIFGLVIQALRGIVQ